MTAQLVSNDGIVRAMNDGIVRAMNEASSFDDDTRRSYLLLLPLSRQGIALLAHRTEDEGVLAQLRAVWRQAEHRCDERIPGRIRPCYRCGGQGKLQTCEHVEDGICFGCGGCGVEMVDAHGKWQAYWPTARSLR